MKLYKFRSLSSIDYTLDIILNERLYCARHQELNDPFEGIFSTIRWSSGSVVQSIVQPIVRSIVQPISGGPAIPQTQYESLDQLPSLNNARVCSLTSELSDILMWSHYAGGHFGCAIEFDLNENENLYTVEYAPSIRKLTSGINEDTSASEILSFKTSHWEYEKEHRIISNEEYYSVDGQITAIYLGIRTKDIHRDIIKKMVGESIPIYATKMNESNVKIEQSTRLNPSD